MITADLSSPVVWITRWVQMKDLLTPRLDTTLMNGIEGELHRGRRTG